jgi:tRNA-specific 2-thiouridylase
MSGGVDSSVSAGLLKDMGCRVSGIHLLLPRFGPDGRPAGAGRAHEDVSRVCETLGIECRVIDFREGFEEAVLNDFCQAYAEGRTPNPCVVCNERVKFGALLEHARSAGADFLATGHYVRRTCVNGRQALERGVDGCDQSYFLYRLNQEQLAAALFPVGEFAKKHVRRMAKERGLSVHDKADSQDLCFVPDGSYRRLLEERCPEAFTPGPIVLTSGEVVGRHGGIAAFTIGQRRGLGVAHSEPLYVVGFDRNENAVIVGGRGRLHSSEILVADVNWVSIAPPREPLEATVRIRYNHAGATATIEPDGRGRARVRFGEPQEAATPGQAAVFHRGDLLLGGGTIQEVAMQEVAA